MSGTQFVLIAGISFAAGTVAQKRLTPALPRALWELGFWVIAPLAVFAGFTLVPLSRDLAAALAAVIATSYLTLLVAFLYASLTARDRRELGALTLAGGFGNAAALGFAFAERAYGREGLALMVVYAQLSWLVPQVAVSTTIARYFGKEMVDGAREHLWRLMLLNPPLIAALVTLVLRGTTDELHDAAEIVGAGVALIVAPFGFFQLGLTVSLERLGYAVADATRAAGAFIVRFAIGPIILGTIAWTFNVSVPRAFYLGAAMPCAFHLIALARVFGLHPRLMRLLVVGSTLAAVGGLALLTVAFGVGAS